MDMDPTSPKPGPTLPMQAMEAVISLQTEEMLTDTIKDKLRKAEIDMGIMAGDMLENGIRRGPVSL